MEAIAYDHPIVGLARTLGTNSACTRVRLGSLGRDEVQAYLSRRFGAPGVAASLAGRVHSRSEGNPLFLVTMADHPVERGFVRKTSAGWRTTRSIDEDDLRDSPNSLREMIELQLASLDRGERELLQAASVAAPEFRSASVAAALEQDGDEGLEAVERACDRLIERRRLRQHAGAQTWPDGTRTTTYRFRHELYRQVLYEGMPQGLRRRCHQRIGERLERAFGPDRMRVAAELVSHFGRSGDDDRTVTYSLLAAEQAWQRYAVPEAAVFLRDALRRLDNLPASPERDLKELQVRMHLQLAPTYRYLEDSEGDDHNFARIRALAALPSAGRDLFQVQSSLGQIYYFRSLPDLAEPVARRLVSLAHPDLPGERMESFLVMGLINMMQGRFVRAAADFASALELYGERSVAAHSSFSAQRLQIRPGSFGGKPAISVSSWPYSPAT